jgi:hypothetical protein
MKTTFLSIIVPIAIAFPSQINAYEVMNHAAMSEAAIQLSSLKDPAPDGKLFRLGLKRLSLYSQLQVFPRAANTSLTGTDAQTCWPVDALAGGRAIPLDFNKLSIIQMIRYGACYEDNVDNGFRVFGHFYNPQSGGLGLNVPASGQQPSSVDWALTGNGATTGTLGTGINHFTYADARTAFYKAITQPTKLDRDKNWGLTFQMLGHVAHHLQDMAQPQHVRNDDHCDSTACQIAGQYRPSGYEKLMKTSKFEQVIVGLASTATTPMLFGLPRDFWNSTGSANLNTYVPVNQGIAAYTSTNFVSSGTDYRYSPVTATAGIPSTNPNLAHPIPTSTASETVNIGALVGYTNSDAPDRLKFVCPDVSKCLINFFGSTNQPNSRKSSLSILGQDLRVRPTSELGFPFQFAQNSFTYAATATDLIPKAVEYSAGLINYFFRGEMAIRLPAEGLYGIIDGGNPASTCKDSCGFPKLKLRVKNTTAAINGVAQDMVGGTLVGVVKFSRNSCYTPDWLGDPGELNAYDGAKVTSCLLGGTSEPVEEIIVSAPVSASFSLAAGAEQQITLDFSAKPIPVNAWNLKVQLVYQGQLGLEPNAVAVTTQQLSAPTVFRVSNESNYLQINQKLYTRAQVNANQTLLAQVSPTSCVTGGAGSRTLVPSCFTATAFNTDWRAPGGQTLAALTPLPIDSYATLLMLGDSRGSISGTSRSIDTSPAGISLSVRTFYLDDATNDLFASSLISHRGLATSFLFYNVIVASVDTTPASNMDVYNRPAFGNVISVPISSINF